MRVVPCRVPRVRPPLARPAVAPPRRHASGANRATVHPGPPPPRQPPPPPPPKQGEPKQGPPPKTAARARRDEMRERLQAEGAIDIEVEGPIVPSNLRSKLVRRAQGRPQTKPEVAVALYDSVLQQLMQNPERVNDPELTQYITDACSLLGATDIKLRETILQMLGLFTTAEGLRKNVLASTAEILLHMADDPGSPKELLFSMLLLVNLTTDEQGANYLSARGIAALVMNCLARQPAPAPLKVKVTAEASATPSEVGYPIPIRIAALTILKNISHLQINDQAMTNDIFIQYLSRSIRSPEDEERELSMFVLMNMSALEPNQKAAAKAGIIDTLLAMLRADPLDNMASMVLSNVTAAPEAPPLAQKLGAVSILISYLTPATNPAMLVNALISIGNMCTNENARTDMVNQGLMKRLEGMLDAPSREIQEYATWALGKFIEHDKRAKESVWQTEVLGMLLDLSEQDDPIVRKNAVHAIVLALRDSPSNQKALVDLANSVSHLQTMCADPEELAETKGLALLSLGMVASNDELWAFVETTDLIRWMLSYIITAPPPLQVSALLALAKAVDSYKCAVELASVDIDKVVMRLASRKFASEEERKRNKEDNEQAKELGLPTKPDQDPEVGATALGLLEKLDVVLRSHSGIGLEELQPAKPLT